jgi:hypothetical protein
MRFGAKKMDADPVINGNSGDDALVEQEPVIRGTTLSFSIVVGAATPRQKTDRDNLISFVLHHESPREYNA